MDVPSVFFTDSTGRCYHTNQDEPGVVDYGKLEQQIATSLAVTRELANTDDPPAWTENAAVVYADAVTFAGVVDLAATRPEPVLGPGPADAHRASRTASTRSATTGPANFDQNDVNVLVGDALNAVNLLTRGPAMDSSATSRPARNDELIQRFYGAFARHDGDAMAACYAPDAHFSDPVFTDLRGEEPGAMWRMLTGRAEDLEVTAGRARGRGRPRHAPTGSPTTRSAPGARSTTTSTPSSASRTASSRSTATRSRSTRGRGRRWGPAGLALGWTPIVRARSSSEARAGLDEFLGR